MLKFVKEGKTLMTEKDNGEVDVKDKKFAEKLQEFITKENVTVKKEEE